MQLRRAKSLSILISLLFVLAFVFYIFIAKAKEIAISNPVLTPTPIPISLVEKINEGLALLKSSPPLQYDYKTYTSRYGKVIASSELARKQIALAVLNTNNGEVFEKRVWVNEDDVANAKKTGIVPFVPADPKEDLDIQAKWWNSFNSDIEVVNHPELVVVANKYLMKTSDLTGLSEKGKGKFTDILYVPYSDGLHTQEMVQAGRDYLDEIVSSASSQLDNKKVLSHSESGKLVTQVVTPEFLKTILLVEHIDPDGFTFAADGGRQLTERVLVIIGANREKAFRYTGSPAGAYGIAQFIKSTYNTTSANYPGAGLIKDFVGGMADHVNAVKAMVLFFDSHKEELQSKINSAQVKQMGVSEEMLAAAYNGGPGRVVKSVNNLGLSWLSKQFSGTAQIFRDETLTYLKKFESIRDLHIF